MAAKSNARPPAVAPARKKVNLALQGGGSHGAYTWGVLDALIEDERIDIGAISGASAGAMNAVVYAEGVMERGRDGARDKLHDFWLSVSQEGSLPQGPENPFSTILAALNFSATPIAAWLDSLSGYASPYEFNPFNLNPLRDHLEKMVDFELLRGEHHLQLFIAATNVQSGKGEIFRRQILTADHVMASACLPRLFQAVEIGGVPYWDGGYAGNPPLWPLFYETKCLDTIIVQINPIERDETPRTAREIGNRVNEITFNSGLLAELRAADFVARLIDRGVLQNKGYRRENIHRIGGDGKLETFGAETKLNVSWSFLKTLRDLGRESTKDWLERNFDAIGHNSTLDMRRTLNKPEVSGS